MELIRQQDKNDCGVANCVMIVNHYQKQEMTIEDFKLSHNYQRNEYSLEDIRNILLNYHIDITYYKIDSLVNIVDANSYPVLLLVKNKEGLNHYITIGNYEDNLFEVYDPDYKIKKKLSYEQLSEISLNIVGFTKKENRKEELKKVNEFNKKYFLRAWLLFKSHWITFSLINLLVVLNSFTFFFSNMFIKVLLSEYAYLTIKRAVLIVSIFIGLVSVWLLLTLLMRRLCDFNDKRVLHYYFSYLDDHYDLVKVSNSFSKEQQLQEIFNLISVTKQQLYLINNLIGFIVFTSLVITLTSHISKVLLTGTLILMIVLFVLKIIQAKRTIKNSHINKLNSNRTNYFTNSLVNNFIGINQRVNLDKYLELHSEFLKNGKTKDNSVIIYIEKLNIYLYYFLMIYCLYATDLDISLFLVVTNITFVYSQQLETLLTNLNGSFLLNMKLNIVNNLKLKEKDNVVLKGKIRVKNNVIKNNVVRVKHLEDVLIDYKTINQWKESNDVFDTSCELVLTDTIANNLFNFGNNKGIENYSLFKLQKHIEELKIDLTLKAEELNEEQKDFIKLTSCLFSKKKIIVIKKNKYRWFLLIEKDIKKHLKDKVVIVYE